MIRPNPFLFALAGLLLAVPSAMAQIPSYGPPPMVGGYGGVPPGVSYDQNVVNYRVNQHGSRWNESQPIEAFLSQVSRRSWIKVEYMLWDIEDPGQRTIGAPIGDEDGRVPFQVENPATGDLFGFAVVPNFDNVTLNDNISVRGTYGIWFDGGEIEFSVFGNEQSSDRVSFPNLQANRPEDPDPLDPNPPAPDAGLGTENNPNVIIPLTSNGGVSDSGSVAFLGFDSSYDATLRSQFWGTEFNILSKPQASVNALQWQWLGGIRYVSFDEDFNQRGVNDAGGTIAPEVFNIRSSTTNNMYGPTAGFRAKLDSKYVTLSVTPRITFALNDHTNRLSTSGSGFDSPSNFSDEQIDFTTLTQVSFLAEVHPSEGWTFFGGYDFFWSSRTSRPFRGTDFDSSIIGDSVSPQLGLQPNPESLSIDGFSFGATYRF